MNIVKDITGVILAGGKSLRYGKDKAFELFRGTPLIERVISVMKEIFSEVIIITNDLDKYREFGLKTYEDIIKDVGPIAGILTGLIRIETEAGFFVACDMPFLNSRLIRYMLKEKDGFDVTVPKIGEYIEPIHAIYTKRCIPFIEEAISLKKFNIRSFFEKVSVRYIQKEEILELDPEMKSFININSPEDLRRYLNV